MAIVVVGLDSTANSSVPPDFGAGSPAARAAAANRSPSIATRQYRQRCTLPRSRRSTNLILISKTSLILVSQIVDQRACPFCHARNCRKRASFSESDIEAPPLAWRRSSTNRENRTCNDSGGELTATGAFRWSHCRAAA